MARLAGFCLALACAWAMAARAQDAVTLRAIPGEGYTRVELVWPEALADAVLDADVSVEYGVAIARLSRPIVADASVLMAAASDEFAAARLDPDGRVLRLALRAPREARLQRSENVLAIDLVDPDERDQPPPLVSARETALRAAEARRNADAAAAAEAAERARAEREAERAQTPVDVRFAEAGLYSRLIFEWPSPVAHELDVVGSSATLAFAAPGRIDLAALNADPPKGVVGAQADLASGGVQVTLDLAEGMRARSWSDEGRVVVDVLFPPDGEPSPSPAVEPDVQADPPAADAETDLAVSARASIPDGTVVTPRAATSGAGLSLTFDWPVGVGAAVFRRGDGLWIVFDASAEMDLSEVTPLAGSVFEAVQGASGADYSAVRLAAPPTLQAEVSAQDDGARWSVRLTPNLEQAPQRISVRRVSPEGGDNRIEADVAGARPPVWLHDPVVGDTLVVVTASPPAAGMWTERTFAELRLLASAQGLAVESRVDDLIVRLSGPTVAMSRPNGLVLTPQNASDGASRFAGQSTTAPGFMDFAAWRGVGRDFFGKRTALVRAVASAESPGAAELDLARFLLGHELAAEALGVVRRLKEREPAMANDPRLLALEGVSLALMGRREAAREVLSAPSLRGDEAAALWRGVLATQARDWRGAREAFVQGESAIFLHEPKWRALFHAGRARSAFELGDTNAAQRAVETALTLPVDEDDLLPVRLVDGLIAERLGDQEAAIAAYSRLIEAGESPLEAEAWFYLTRLQREAGLISVEEADERMDALSLRWRGGDLEIDIVRDLAQTAFAANDFRRGFSLLRGLQARYPDSLVVRDVAQEMTREFEAIFEDGGSRFDPIEALGLWFEFRELTPVGATGDRMIRRLANRLVEIDLLPQAAELLTHQVDNRLRGAARSMVAADLAAIQLLDRDPEAALQTLSRTRFSNLPDSITRERRLLQARALAELGRYAAAQDLLEADRDPTSLQLQADMAWEQRDWARAGGFIVAVLGEAHASPTPYNPRVEDQVLKAAIAMTLAGDDAGLDQLRTLYGAGMAQGGQAAAWAVVAGSPNVDGAQLRDIASRLADEQTLDAFVADFRARRAAQDTNG